MSLALYSVYYVYIVFELFSQLSVLAFHSIPSVIHLETSVDQNSGTSLQKDVGFH